MSGGFFPWLRIRSAGELTPERLKEMGVRGLIFDIDNTLVPHGAPADEESVRYFTALRAAGIRTAFVSNNHAPRVAPFAEAAESPFICDAGKPSRKGFREALRLMGTEAEETLSVGDQIFTDVWGANRSGIRSVLVVPVEKKEPFTVKLKRLPEKIVLFLYEIREKRLKNRRA